MNEPSQTTRSVCDCSEAIVDNGIVAPNRQPAHSKTTSSGMNTATKSAMTIATYRATTDVQFAGIVRF
ncbi:hypothetical protein [Bradyrhizobium sp. USDA 4369]